MESMKKREIVRTQNQGLSSIGNIILVGVLLAAGVVLKFLVGASFPLMKPNFVIAMYCLSIMLIRPKGVEAVIIGILAGAVCQFFPAVPYVNLLSEPVGAIAMALVIRLPFLRIGKLNLGPTVGTFLATLASGFSFVGLTYLMFYMGATVTPTPLAAFMAIIFGTAFINAIIVQVLYLPLKAALKKD